MSAKFSPGPWECDRAKDGNGHYYQIDAPTPKGINPSFPYTVADTLNRHHCISPEEDTANANLLAAAPEMYEALKDADDTLARLGLTENMLGRRRVRAVLAKVEKRQ